MSQTVYVLTLKTWDCPPAHHTYGRIHWEAPFPCDHGSITMANGEDRCTVCGVDCSTAGHQSADSEAQPDADGFCTIRHETRSSAIAGARRWFEQHHKPGDVLVVGSWSLCGWDSNAPFEVLEGELQ